MGITKLFGAEADMKIAKNMNLTMTDIPHKAVVDINENGFVDASNDIPSDNVVDFFCNRPFVFIIHDIIGKRILFIGLYRNGGIDTKLLATRAAEQKAKEVKEQEKLRLKEEKNKRKAMKAGRLAAHPTVAHPVAQPAGR